MISDLSIILLFKKRWRLFILSLGVCLVVGSIFVYKQIQIINQSKENFLSQEQTEILDQDNTLLFMVKKYKQITLPDKPIQDILKHFVSEGVILDFRLYTQSPYFDSYVIFYENTGDNPSPIIQQALNSNPIITETKKAIFALAPTLGEEQDDIKAYAKKVEQEGFFTFLDAALLDLNFSDNRPINKHYIYLDKDRNLQKGYNISSTEIIKGHTSLNSNKIWVFMVICSILASIFVVFSVENINALLKRIKATK